MSTSVSPAIASVASSPSSSTVRALVFGALLCGVLDITAACVQAWVQAGATPPRVLKGVASALLGASANNGGAGIAAMGLFMHFIVATCATLLFYALSRRIPILREGAVWLVGPIYGLFFWVLMNYATLPLLSVLRSLYLDTAPRFPGSMKWPQMLIHMAFVGTPIVWCLRRFGPR